MTETVSNALYAGKLPGFGAKGMIGKPIDCEAQIKSLGAGGVDTGEGELQIRGSNVCDGYWNDAVRTAETITGDGWLNTGDLVRQLDDGSYEFLGRLNSVINSGGTMILPQEIDEVLLAHPSIADAVTIGMPDDLFEEIAVSCIQLKEKVSDDLLFRHCRVHLAALKVPKRIIRLPIIPRGAAGKPVLQELRQLVTGQLQDIETPSDSGSPVAGVQSVEQQLLEVAAEAFHSDLSALNLSSSPATIAAWDSFTHIHLVLAIEERLAVSLAADQIAGSRTLGQLLDAVMKSRHVDQQP